jgi:hypothetical protein
MRAAAELCLCRSAVHVVQPLRVVFCCVGSLVLFAWVPWTRRCPYRHHRSHRRRTPVGRSRGRHVRPEQRGKRGKRSWAGLIGPSRLRSWAGPAEKERKLGREERERKRAEGKKRREGGAFVQRGPVGPVWAGLEKWSFRFILF